MQLTLPLLLLPLTLASPFNFLDLAAQYDLTPKTTVFGSTGKCGTCNPNPPNNLCNPTTACATIGKNTYCACRAGFRATTAASPGDTSVQWRLPTQGQEGRVFVAPGVTCNTLCTNWQLGPKGCQEVGMRNDCA